jgi:CBS domain-containing protein
MEKMQVKELMETNLKLIDPDATLEEAAKKMKESDCGFLPVGTDSIPQGIITDRDIVVRALAEGCDPKSEKVRDFMTSDVCSCMETDTLEEAALVMGVNNVSRLVVKDGTDGICGILTFGRIIRTHNNKQEVSDVVQKATGKAA